MLYKRWISGLLSTKQVCYQPVTNCTYWIVLSLYNNWNIIELTPKSIPFETFDEINKVFLDGISENMASLVQSGMYGAINTYGTTKNGLYVIQFILEAYMLKNNATIDGQVLSASELVVRAQYLCSIQENTNSIKYRSKHCK